MTVKHLSHKPESAKGVPLYSLFILFVMLACTEIKPVETEGLTADVFLSGDGQFSHYRIPSLVKNERCLFAFAEGRKAGSQDHGEISIVLRRSDDRGQTWGTLIPVVESPGTSAQNPTPVWIAEKSKLILLFTKRTVGSDTEHMIRSGTSQGYVGVFQTESMDSGLTWSSPVEITDMVKRKDWYWYALGPGGAITMQYHPEFMGRIIIPANHSLSHGSSNEYLGAHVIWSDDKGENWQIGAVDSQGEGLVNPNETAVVELLNGDLYFNTRNHSMADSAGHRATTTSSDGGGSFNTLFHHEIQLITPVVHASLARNRNSLFFAAPSGPDERINLSLWRSDDEGVTWIYDRLLYEGSSAYSGLCAMEDDFLCILFEADDYGKIIFTLLPPGNGGMN